MLAKIVAATYNAHKLEEYKKLLAEQDVEVVSLVDYPEAPEIEENGNSFEENAAIKALEANKYCDIPAFADDSGLVVEALDGAPGIYSSRYAENDEKRIARLLEELTGQDNRKAKFVCIIAIAANGEVVETFRGEVAGTIIAAPRGDNGFGYDPVFVPNGYDKTFAELTQTEKNKISHRAKAFELAIEFIEDEMSVLDDEFGEL